MRTQYYVNGIQELGDSEVMLLRITYDALFEAVKGALIKVFEDNEKGGPLWRSAIVYRQTMKRGESKSDNLEVLTLHFPPGGFSIE